jgi:DNA polymerase
MAVYNPDLYADRKATIEGMAGKPILVRGRWGKRKSNLVVDQLWTLEELAAGKFRGLNLPIMEPVKDRSWVPHMRKDVLSCTACDLRAGCKHPVPGEVGLMRLMVVSEAPGKVEDETGRGLVGAAGKTLWAALGKHGLSRELFGVESVIHCKPKDLKFPGLPYVGKCKWLTESIQKAKPYAILALGNPAMYYFNGQPKGIREKNATTEWNPAAQAWVTYCLHPSSTIHDPANIPEFERGIGEYARVLGEIS